MTDTMHAMLMAAPGQPLISMRVSVPHPAAGQALLRVYACGVCRADLHIPDGELPNPQLPLILGHEIVIDDDDHDFLGTPVA